MHLFLVAMGGVLFLSRFEGSELGSKEGWVMLGGFGLLGRANLWSSERMWQEDWDERTQAIEY